MITLSDGAVTLQLDDSMDWTDEHTWAPVQQSVESSVTGAVVVDVATRQAGREITLAGGETYGWITYNDVWQIKQWAAVAGKQLTLGLRGQSFTVIFRHHEAPAFEARAVIPYADPASGDWYIPTIKMMEV